MSVLAERLIAVWYAEAAPPAWLRALEPAYLGVTALRRTGYRRGWLRSGHPGVPVVVIGNLTVGGTGKTPLVIWLARQLVDRGRVPAIVSRGYGGTSPARPRRIAAGDTAAEVGDEPLLIARDTGCAVWVSRDRLAASCAAADGGADVVIADDGLQHYRLDRDLEIAVVDGVRGFGNGHALPAGPLREPLARLEQVDVTVCNGDGRCPEGALGMRLSGDDARRIGDGSVRPLTDFAPGPVHAVAAIGHPERFFAHLERHGLRLLRHPLPDHAPLPASLLPPGDGLPVLMTSKDAVRGGGGAAGAWEVPVVAELAERGETLLARVQAVLDGYPERHRYNRSGR